MEYAVSWNRSTLIYTTTTSIAMNEFVDLFPCIDEFTLANFLQPTSNSERTPICWTEIQIDHCQYVLNSIHSNLKHKLNEEYLCLKATIKICINLYILKRFECFTRRQSHIYCYVRVLNLFLPILWTYKV